MAVTTGMRFGLMLNFSRTGILTLEDTRSSEMNMLLQNQREKFAVQGMTGEATGYFGACCHVSFTKWGGGMGYERGLES